MPGMDGTGPTGQGRTTGRGLGPCGTGANGMPQTGSQPGSWIGRSLLAVLGGLFSGNYTAGRGGGRGTGGGRGQGRRRRF